MDIDITDRRAAKTRRRRIESERRLRDQGRFLENLDRISRILTGRVHDAGLITELAGAILDIFQADRVFFLHPCDPDAATFRIRIEVTRPEWPGVFADREVGPDGVEFVPEESFRAHLRQALSCCRPLTTQFADFPPDSVAMARHYGIQSQLAAVLYPQADQPWQLSLHQCSAPRQWTDTEQRLFQTIAERVGEALSGHLLLQRLQASEQRFAKAFRSSPAPMLVTTINEGRILDVNERWLDLLEAERERLIGRTTLELDIWVDPEQRARMMAQLRATGPFQNLPLRIRSCRGNLREVLWSTEIIRFGAEEALLSSIHDLTEQRRTERMLRLTRAAIDRSRIGFYWLSTGGQIVDVNQAAADSLGYSREELIGLHVWDIDPNHRPDMSDETWSTIRRLKSIAFESSHRRKDGTIFPIEGATDHICMDDEEYAFTFVQDISDRKAAESELRASEERFARAFRSSPALTVISTLDEGRFIDANDRWLDAMGYRREEVIGRTAEDIALWVDADERARLISILKTRGSLRDVPVRIRGRTGEEFDHLWSAEIISLSGQSVLLSAVQDITERKRTDQALRLAQFCILHASDAVFWITPEARFIYVNDQACSSLGYARDELLNMSVWDIDPDFSPQRWSEHWEKTRILKKHGLETRHRRRDGVIFPVEVVVNYMEYEGKEYDFAFVRDISERRQAEKELARHREHLEELVAQRTTALEAANAHLQQAMTQLVQAEKLAALGSLVAGLAHELNTPLGNARMVASTLDEWLSEATDAVHAGGLRRSQLIELIDRGREATDLINRNTARAADLINHFKEVAIDQTSMRRRRFNLRQTVAEALTTLGPTLKRTTHQIAVRIPSDLELDSYPGPLEQVIANLISNSVTHAFSGMDAGSIEIAAHAEGSEHIAMIYRDNGSGIPDALQNRIFEPFFTTRLGLGGSGLGLYIVYNLVTGVLGGGIRVESRENQGTTFLLNLACSAPQQPAVME